MTTRRRPAFTIFEILIALAIGLMLLAALYFAVSVQMRSAQSGRQLVQQNTLARSVFRRLDNDLTATLNLTDPARWRNQMISSSMSSSSASSSSNSTATTSNGVFQTSTIVLPAPITGYYPSNFAPSDDQHLNFYFTRFPREVYQPAPGDSGSGDDQTQNQVNLSDVRCISYWFVQGKGLYRQEIAQATSDDALNTQYPDDDTLLIAPEVTNVTFSYFDGVNWQTSWDGTVVNTTTPNGSQADGITPQGSPRAIKILLEIQLPKNEYAVDPKAPPRTKQYSHVILVQSGNGPTPLNSANTTILSGGGTQP